LHASEGLEAGNEKEGLTKMQRSTEGRKKLYHWKLKKNMDGGKEGERIMLQTES